MKIDIIYTYFNGSSLLKDYIYHWSNNFNNIKHNINFTIVDDHSSDRAIDTIQHLDVNCNLQVYYIDEDIIWNEEGARNLGVKTTSNDILLILDWDCIVYEKLIEEILTWDFNNNFYQFSTITDGITLPGKITFNFLQSKKNRDNRNMIMFEKSAGAIALNRDLFTLCGGYDEDFRGNYGFSDTLFVKNLSHHGARLNRINNNLLFTTTAGESNTSRFTDDKNIPLSGKLAMKYSKNYELFEKKKHKQYKPINPIRFKYTKQYQHHI